MSRMACAPTRRVYRPPTCRAGALMHRAMKEPLNVRDMMSLASCCGRVARVLPIQMIDDVIETVRRSEVAWHAAVCLQRDVLAEGMPAHDMGLPDSQSSEEFPISPQVPEDNSVFSRTTLHAALGGGDVATS